ncbi:MAG: PIG-L deacetylase family protein [Bacteroidota bacterium]
MRVSLVFTLLFFVPALAVAQIPTDRPLNIICIGAHPDDCDVKMGATAARYAEMGHRVKFVSLTNGNAGHQSEGGGALAKRRRAESEEAGRQMGIAEYEVLDNHDAELMPTLQVRHQIIRLIREWNADVVVTHRPNDYHPDHRNAGIAVQDAAYLVIVPNVASDTEPRATNPAFFYLSDRFRKPYPFDPLVAVDVASTIDKKLRGLAAHDSQMFEWLPWTAGNRDLEDIPNDFESRLEWLSERWIDRPVPATWRTTLGTWYGPDTAAAVQYAEAFELCEYGYQPAAEELPMLFPMLP